MINPHVVRKTYNPDSPPAEPGMHWINVSTNEEFFSVGTSTIDDWIPRRRSGFRSYVVVITQQNLINKNIVLPYTPVNPDEVAIKPVGGIEQVNGVDFEVNNNVLTWDNLGLDNFLEENDVLIVQH
jgi:hypothetical protein